MLHLRIEIQTNPEILKQIMECLSIIDDECFIQFSRDITTFLCSCNATMAHIIFQNSMFNNPEKSMGVKSNDILKILNVFQEFDEVSITFKANSLEFKSENSSITRKTFPSEQYEKLNTLLETEDQFQLSFDKNVIINNGQMISALKKLDIIDPFFSLNQDEKTGNLQFFTSNNVVGDSKVIIENCVNIFALDDKHYYPNEKLLKILTKFKENHDLELSVNPNQLLRIKIEDIFPKIKVTYFFYIVPSISPD